MAEWAAGQVGLHFIPAGEPWRNGYIDSFNSRIRDECLNVTSFWSLTQARVVISDWKHDYNHHHRHSAPNSHNGGPTTRVQIAWTSEPPRWVRRLSDLRSQLAAGLRR
jgi:Integrase core domain